jgi:hypothetical protein
MVLYFIITEAVTLSIFTEKAGEKFEIFRRTWIA